MKLRDYTCKYDAEVMINQPSLITDHIPFPDVHYNSEYIVKLANLQKKSSNDEFYLLPFCHTLEGEAMGAIITIGDETYGPRAKKYVCESFQDIIDLPDIDFSTGRIFHMLEAIRKLNQSDNEVIFMLSGPFTILNTLIEPRKIFKIFKKNPKAMQKIFDKIQLQLLNFTRELKKCGVRVISYSDSSGGLNILGPRFFRQTLDMFVVETLEKMAKILGDTGVLHLCPKTSVGLVSGDRGIWQSLTVETTSYREAIKKSVGKTSFLGETCLKNISYQVKNNTIKTIVLTPKESRRLN